MPDSVRVPPPVLVKTPAPETMPLAVSVSASTWQDAGERDIGGIRPRERDIGRRAIVGDRSDAAARERADDDAVAIQVERAAVDRQDTARRAQGGGASQDQAAGVDGCPARIEVGP